MKGYKFIHGSVKLMEPNTKETALAPCLVCLWKDKYRKYRAEVILSGRLKNFLYKLHRKHGWKKAQPVGVQVATIPKVILANKQEVWNCINTTYHLRLVLHRPPLERVVLLSYTTNQEDQYRNAYEDVKYACSILAPYLETQVPEHSIQIVDEVVSTRPL